MTTSEVIITALSDSIATRSTLAISNDTNAPVYFSLLPANITSSQAIYVAVSLCSGPVDGVRPTISPDLSPSERLELERSSLVRVYVSTDSSNQLPGPDSVPSGDDGEMAYAAGGFAQLNLTRDSSYTFAGVWVAVWPPTWAWGQTGDFVVDVVASLEVPSQRLASQYGVRLDDTDSTRALVTSFNYTTGLVPNMSLIVLPTLGEHALTSTYYNSSYCAIQDAWEGYLASSQGLLINSNETRRGQSKSSPGNDRRLQFEIAGLTAATNYTVWPLSINASGSNENGSQAGVTLYPAVKFLTKQGGVCRLVWDVDFCPDVAYSIPLDSTISTEDALSIINETVTPNYANFSRTLSTWSCDDSYFGQYSAVQSCTDCLTAYRNWLCAISMPRCTDPINVMSNQSAAEPDVNGLTGRTLGPNTGLLPYVLNRNGSHSRQSYIGDGLGVRDSYGEVLPCLYTCLFVQRACPAPLFSWICPRWDVTAQHDYGTFADSGSNGLGASENGGAGDDLARWGGPLRYIAQDNFGHTYCNALGVDIYLREQNVGVGGKGDTLETMTGLMAAMLLTIFATMWASR